MAYFNLSWQKTLFIILILCSLNISSQTTESTFVLNKTTLKELIDTLAFKLETRYVLPEKAIEMSKYVRKRYKDGFYKNISDPNILANVLTQDILNIHNDEHFYIEYNPKLAEIYTHPYDSVYFADLLKVSQTKNFGFKKIEILNGNIGYIDISYFAYLTPESEKTANAAFQVLANCDALIIDLRYGMGGQPEMVCSIAKHFLKDKTLMMEGRQRYSSKPISFYSEPDADYTDLYDTPLYILTSYKTFSAAEMLSYTLKNTKRAIIVGEQTRGGAHNSPKSRLYGNFIISLPHGKAYSYITNSNWEGIGITPDIKTNAENSLQAAELDIFENYFKNSKDSVEKIRLKWQFDLLKAKNLEPILEQGILEKRVGIYNYIDISMKDNLLYYEKVGKTKFPLVPMTEKKMRLKGNDSFIVEFIKDKSNNVTEIITYSEEGSIEHSARNK